MVENCNLIILSQQERAIYKARNPADFLSLAPKLGWTSLGFLITKAEKLINYYADRDMFDNLTAMFRTVEALHWWLTLKVYEDKNAPEIIKRDTLNIIKEDAQKILEEAFTAPGVDDRRALIVDGRRMYRPDVSFAER
ncbi:hypothetical protein A2954_03960 [Candidatus Roizmanbacteria bacterium RIFCSPLOWO2_01_FULL_37_12]|uniref:Uncharacterized protein n=1 Tax=Candidatus Roizmanbacteria bacterium RIFCSPLOWO2_01_FULL_37_12 TaxID=1802056 RepID=A0A1F7IER2_9BACT|nr:MAG: hypothetical protein A3D76_03195 [Candidatus Roizmanbacteria bacterium RIFCSPHIGHO2_02_FULL_37_9b]OGK41840.1 MAG: hypothetical protein A2954_03960 [Candidatus Roizmanbacteria bacterium RIFCSPLOWO2_01_FULL_37_12]